eukprot:GHUV01031876.1.p1 GENE.GHUV01031876.1~~GHUV01031876.1.p1  ORF type:complete len:232 (+),score=32.28 GHUV01031876.1:58-753(+)
MRQRVLVRLDGAIQECTSSPGLVAHLKRCAMTVAHRHTNDASKLSYMDGADSRTGLVQDRDLPWWKQETVLQVAVALLYAVVATSMSIINRLALLVFPLPTVLLLLQMTATVAILYPLLWARVLTFKPWSFSRFQQLLGISFFYTANTAFALFGLRGMNLPMYTAVKRLTPMVILVTKVSARNALEQFVLYIAVVVCWQFSVTACAAVTPLLGGRQVRHPFSTAGRYLHTV